MESDQEKKVGEVENGGGGGSDETPAVRDLCTRLLLWLCKSSLRWNTGFDGAGDISGVDCSGKRSSELEKLEWDSERERRGDYVGGKREEDDSAVCFAAVVGYEAVYAVYGAGR